MVSIPRLPATVNSQKPQKGRSLTKTKQAKAGSQVSKVAQAVSLSVNQTQHSEFERARIHYDLPEGRNKKALEEYIGVMQHSKKEELARLLGIDIYI
ncbi:chromosome partitioning protein ParA [Vibrio sp. ZSDZ34]|jgi:hypothetical protein|uniref:Chromosome partitioning protein ParA n=1 Tax=Vibrio gelatinilyticus TaxID=2893468 RepID=A0A9X1W7Z6_9VIBR|nr:chromosome partitioning protein ParA [Vibrio gelatinilyticus]MCJ2375678.1 chromosome partitioning protein ParA [Vibrio gelatinilyticus]